MKLELIKECSGPNLVSKKDYEFNFYKNVIQKELELSCWSNKVNSIFGNFQIYSDFKSELNCFDQIITFVMKNCEVYRDGTAESELSNYCSDHFLNLIIKNGCQLNTLELETLANKYTQLITNATELMTSSEDYNKNIIKVCAEEILSA